MLSWPGVLNVDPRTELSWASFYLETWRFHTPSVQKSTTIEVITAGSLQSRQCGRAAGPGVQPVLLKRWQTDMCLSTSATVFGVHSVGQAVIETAPQFMPHMIESWIGTVVTPPSWSSSATDGMGVCWSWGR